jgi:hypothetical protein
MYAALNGLIVDAIQWFKNGDHPDDDVTRGGTTPNGEAWEGKIVRYYRHPQFSGDLVCPRCGKTMHDHGWLDDSSNEGAGQVVCPGDWVVRTKQGVYCVVGDGAFFNIYSYVFKGLNNI